VLVDAIAAPEVPALAAGKSYRLLARKSTVTGQQAQVDVIKACVDAALAGKGMFEAPAGLPPDLFIEVGFGVAATPRVDAGSRETFLQLAARANASRGIDKGTGPELWDVRVAVLGVSGRMETAMPLLAAVAACNAKDKLRFYPGSPELARLCLRLQDRYAGCELHPIDAAALRARYAADRRLQIHARDGWEALKALTPPPEKRGLVLIDPPYEKPDEALIAARAIGGALKRFGHGVYLWWRPLKDPDAIALADAELFKEGIRPALAAQLTLAGLRQGLRGSSVLILNPPYGLSEDLGAFAQSLKAALPSALRPEVQVAPHGLA